MNRDGSKDDRVRLEMIEAFKGVVDAINKTKLSKRSSQLDKTRSKPYWSTMVEMSARSFESYVIHKLGDQGQQNGYLANFKEVTEWINDTKGNIDVKNNYPYLLKDEVHTVHEAYNQFFNNIEEEQNPDGSILVKEYIDIAYGSEEKHREAVETIVREQLDIQFKGIDSSDNKVSETTEGDDLSADRRFNSIREIQQRTVLRDFQESGHLNYVGRLIKSPVDVADLYQVYRSPLIEKTHIILTKDGKIVGDAALTAGYISAAPTPNVDFIRTLIEAHGADQFYLLHNHPSGNPTPSTDDIQFTNGIVDAFHDSFSGHIVINADKFSLIHSSNKKLPLKVKEYPYTPKDNLGQLFSNRFKIDGSQQHMAQVAEALLKRDGIRGAIIYLQSNLSISAYDAVTPDMDPIDVVKTATRGLNNNLGRNVIFVQEEGSFDITSEKLPPETLDVIQIGVAEGKTVVTAPDYGMNRLTVFQRKIGSPKRLWEQPYAYGQSADNQGTFDPNNPDIRFTKVGPKEAQLQAMGVNGFSLRENLYRAGEMFVKGQPMNEIKLATGWAKDKQDGKWKYEISDKEYSVNFGKLYDLYLGAPTFTELQEVIRHSRLFKVYPQLKKLRIEVGKTIGNAHYEKFENGQAKIVISQDLVRATRDLGQDGGGRTDGASRRAKVSKKLQQTIIHEIQHAIQDIEGFAGGGNPQTIKEILIKEGKLPKSTLNVPYDKLSQEFRDEIYEKYIRVAGEAEARDTQQKIDLTEEELAEEPFLSRDKVNPDELFTIDGDDIVSNLDFPKLKRDFSDAAVLGQAVTENPALAASAVSNPQIRERKLGAVNQMVEEIKLSNPWLPNINVYESMLDFKMKYGVDIEGANQVPGFFTEINPISLPPTG
jgi:hypothetical protein